MITHHRQTCKFCGERFELVIVNKWYDLLHLIGRDLDVLNWRAQVLRHEAECLADWQSLVESEERASN